MFLGTSAEIGKHLFACDKSPRCMGAVLFKPNKSDGMKAIGGWFVAVIIVLFVMQWGVGELNRRILTRQTRNEFAQLQQMLEKFRERNGEYPRVSSNPVLLQCLLGRFDARGKPIEQQPWFLAGATLFFRDRFPEKLGNHIVDPWGTSYLYRSFPSEGSWQLVSDGPDRKHSNPVLWPPMQNGTAPEDADNLSITSSSHGPGVP